MSSESSEIPFGGRLSSAVDEAVRAQVEHHLAKRTDPGRIQELTDSIPYESLVDGVSETVYGRLQNERPSIVEYIDNGQRLVQQALVDVWGSADEIFRACVYGSWELGGAISRASERHGPQVFALLGLHGRAVRVAGEVRHLAMGGFESGATARHRSLHDITVVSLILSRAPEDIAQRYLDYSHIERLGDVRQYQKHAEALRRKPFSDAEVQVAEAAAERVARQWGSTMREQNGWAYPLLPRNQEDLLFGLGDPCRAAAPPTLLSAGQPLRPCRTSCIGTEHARGSRIRDSAAHHRRADRHGRHRRNVPRRDDQPRTDHRGPRHHPSV